MKNILILNPNSSNDVTLAMSKLVPHPPSGIRLVFMTAPKDAPSTINNAEDAIKSADACMKLFESDPERYLCFDGYLIGCFSNHPLIYRLRSKFSSKKHQPVVLGILQTSVLYAVSQVGGPNVDRQKIVILTSGNSWKPILDKAVHDTLCGPDSSGNDSDYSKRLPTFFMPTEETGMGVLELARPEGYKKLVRQINGLKNKGAKFIILGCAGFSGMDHKFRRDVPGVVFIDTVKCGIETLCSYVRFNES